MLTIVNGKFDRFTTILLTMIMLKLHSMNSSTLARTTPTLLTAEVMEEDSALLALLDPPFEGSIRDESSVGAGAFLLDEPELIEEIVRALTRSLSVPVSVKVRILPAADGSVDTPKTIAFCQRLEAAGASVICLHGRTRAQNKHLSGGCDWDAIKEAARVLNVPVVANGGISSADDAAACLAHTGAAAVMSSEALLENPALFCRNVHPRTGAYLDQDVLAGLNGLHGETMMSFHVGENVDDVDGIERARSCSIRACSARHLAISALYTALSFSSCSRYG